MRRAFQVPNPELDPKFRRHREAGLKIHAVSYLPSQERLKAGIVFNPGRWPFGLPQYDPAQSPFFSATSTTDFSVKVPQPGRGFFNVVKAETRVEHEPTVDLEECDRDGTAVLVRWRDHDL
jgi:hypothetical protein